MSANAMPTNFVTSSSNTMELTRIGQDLTIPTSIFSGTTTSALATFPSGTTSRIFSSYQFTQSPGNHKSLPVVILPSLTAPKNNSPPNPTPTRIEMEPVSTVYNPYLVPSYTTSAPLTTNYLLLSVELDPDKPLSLNSPITTSPNSSTTSLPTQTKASFNM